MQHSQVEAPPLLHEVPTAVEHGPVACVAVEQVEVAATLLPEAELMALDTVLQSSCGEVALATIEQA